MENNNLALEVLQQMKEEHTLECVRLHQIIKKLIIALIIIVILFIGTNIYWIYNSYLPSEYGSESVEQENDDGQNNYIGNDGEINNGETKGN